MIWQARYPKADPRLEWHERFAWLPTKISGWWIWWEYYDRQRVRSTWEYYDRQRVRSTWEYYDRQRVRSTWGSYYRRSLRRSSFR